MTLPGGSELIIILVIILLLFGAKKLPELAGSMGKSIKEFRKASHEADAEDDATKPAGSDEER
jgi:sec-independent protein translocase protein TatA